MEGWLGHWPVTCMYVHKYRHLDSRTFCNICDRLKGEFSGLPRNKK